MPKYLFHVNYSKQGVQDIIEKGGSHRKQLAMAIMEDAGGTLESFYYAFGTTDAYVVADLPDDESAASASLRVNAGGALTARATKLLTGEQMDAAAEKVPA